MSYMCNLCSTDNHEAEIYSLDVQIYITKAVIIISLV